MVVLHLESGINKTKKLNWELLQRHLILER